MGTTVRHQPMSGFRTTIKVAIGKIKPTGSTVTINGATTPAEKGDTIPNNPFEYSLKAFGCYEFL